MFNVDFSKDVQSIDGLVLIQYSKELYAPWFTEDAIKELEGYLHQSGGAMASPHIDKLARKIMKDKYGITRKFLEFYDIELSNIKGTMWLHKRLTKDLSEEQLLAVIAHEYSHLKLGHLEAMIEEEGGIDAIVESYLRSGKLPIMDSPQRELEADAYAAKMFSGSIMSSALCAIMSNVAVLDYIIGMYPHANLTREEVHSSFIAQNKYRLDALS